MHAEGECAAARAAGAAGTAYILSTISGHALENVQGSDSGANMVPTLSGRGPPRRREAALERAARAGFSVFAVTIDTGTPGKRERDNRNGTAQLKSGNVLRMIPYLPQFLTRPGWLAAFLMDGGIHKLPNIVTPGDGT